VNADDGRGANINLLRRSELNSKEKKYMLIFVVVALLAGG
jgi:hypothetical protein